MTEITFEVCIEMGNCEIIGSVETIEKAREIVKDHPNHKGYKIRKVTRELIEIQCDE